MQCPSCFLRYNSKSRIPKVMTCGHTICDNCLKRVQKCRICGSEIINEKNYALNFSLMQIIQKDTKQIDKYVKVCFVGSSTTGKTSLIKRMMGQQFSEETVTTIGYDFSFQDRIIDDLHIRYQLWDSAGQQKYRAISPIHYKNSDIVVIVYDISQPAIENKVVVWVEETLKNCPEDVKIIIVGNKLDLAEENKMHKPIDENAWKMIESSQYKQIQVSCKTASGIKQFWETLDEEFKKKISEKKKSMINYEKEIQLMQKKRSKLTKLKNQKEKSSYENKANNSSSCC